MTNFRTSQRGVNLIELLTGISIVSISLSLGVPSFENMRQSSDRASALIELVAAVRLARGEAALRGTSVSICPSPDGVNCTITRSWSSGWIVFRDEDEDRIIEDQAQVLRVVRFQHPRFTITADMALGSGITFGTFGFSTPAAGQFAYRDDSAERTIALNYIGRLHVTDTGPGPSS
jgi:type IV fimbrial biogenesis protein FimT